MAPPNYCCWVSGEGPYLLEVVVVADGLAGGHVLVVAGVGQVGVAGLVVELVVLVGETVLKPVSIQSLSSVRVFVHL